MTSEHKIIILYDGNCPICCRKARFIQRRDSADKITFANIRSPECIPDHLPIPFAELEKQIHAVMPDGTIVNRMEVIRVAYRQIGLGWLIAPTGWPVFRPLFDALYGVVAKHRLSISRFFR